MTTYGLQYYDDEMYISDECDNEELNETSRDLCLMDNISTEVLKFAINSIKIR